MPDNSLSGSANGWGHKLLAKLQVTPIICSLHLAMFKPIKNLLSFDHILITSHQIGIFIIKTLNFMNEPPCNKNYSWQLVWLHSILGTEEDAIGIFWLQCTYNQPSAKNCELLGQWLR